MVNILARILDSERNVNGSTDPMITADRGFIQFLGPDFGFWLLGRSDRGSQRSPGNFTLSLLCAGCHAVEKMTRNSHGYINISLIVILNAKTQYRVIQGNSNN